MRLLGKASESGIRRPSVNPLRHGWPQGTIADGASFSTAENAAARPAAFVAGNTFSMADVTVLAGLDFAQAVGLAIPEECIALIA
jgi:hypothetical protein